MKSRRQARAWLYGFTAKSLRALSNDSIRIQRVYGAELTPAQVKRVQLEALALAEKLEAKAARLVATATEETQ